LSIDDFNTELSTKIITLVLFGNDLNLLGVEGLELLGLLVVVAFRSFEASFIAEFMNWHPRATIVIGSVPFAAIEESDVVFGNVTLEVAAQVETTDGHGGNWEELLEAGQQVFITSTLFPMLLFATAITFTFTRTITFTLIFAMVTIKSCDPSTTIGIF